MTILQTARDYECHHPARYPSLRPRLSSTRRQANTNHFRPSISIVIPNRSAPAHYPLQVIPATQFCFYLRAVLYQHHIRRVVDTPSIASHHNFWRVFKQTPKTHSSISFAMAGGKGKSIGGKATGAKDSSVKSQKSHSAKAGLQVSIFMSFAQCCSMLCERRASLPFQFGQSHARKASTHCVRPIPALIRQHCPSYFLILVSPPLAARIIFRLMAKH